MPNMLFTREQIKDLFLTTTYNRGYAYYREGRVRDLKFSPEKDAWFAKVVGDDSYYVTVEKRHQSFSSSCDCPAYDRYLECKHEVAVLLELCDQETNEIGQRGPRAGDYEAVDQFIQLFSGYQQAVLDAHNDEVKQLLEVEFVCKSATPTFLHPQGMYLTLELKIGPDRTYVVKNIKEFLTKVQNQETHEFTKKFTYDPSDYVFKKEDDVVIQMLLELVNTEHFYRPPNPYQRQSSSSLTTDRELLIPTMGARKLLLALMERNFTFVHEEVIYPHVELIEKTLPLSFQLHKLGDQAFELDLFQLHQAAFFDRYDLVFLEGTFYTLSPDQRMLVEGLRQSAVLGETIPIASEQMEDFLSQVLPGLKKIGNVSIDEEVSTKISEPMLQSKVFVDEENGRLVVKLEYHYDDIVINPFSFRQESRGEKGAFLIRDTEKEREIMAIIERAPVKIHKQQLYLDENEDDLYTFLFHVLPRLGRLADVYMSDRAQAYSPPEGAVPSTSIDVGENRGLLEINFDLNGIDHNTIQSVLKSVIEKKSYHRLPDGRFISLEQEDFQTLYQLFDELNVTEDDLTDNRLQVPVYRGMQVEEIMNGKNKYATKSSKAFRRLIQHLKNPEDLDFEEPSNLQAELRDYQHNGFQWFKALSHYALGGVLADDMGLGKTLQSISYIVSELNEQSEKQSFLVVAPASLIYNWKNEFEKFAPHLRVEVITGTPIEREALLTGENEHDVWITSYPTLRQDLAFYQQHTFNTVILDEAQAVKNYTTKTAAAVRSLRAQRKYALSGTPIENSLDELWSLFQTVLPGLFPGYKAFKNLSNDQIARMVRPFILRRVKKDVLKELPDKIESNHVSELTKEQKELYVGYLEEVKRSIQTEDFNKNRIKILAGLTRLRQICCHPSLFIENYEGQSSKLDQLLELTQNAIENGKRLLIFSQFTSMLHIIQERLEGMGISFFYLDGQTPSKERVEMSERFNQGENDVFLISLKAGGTGLNLTGADTVVLYDLWWNPAIEEQAAGRAHRIGQKNVVQVIRLISKGTIEEKIYQLQQKKRELIEQVIQPGETMLSSLTEDEIRELLSM
ncbi:DEAD/DEAH box helicase [Priestia koreensis]|uniref:DEAD/DEAH box helicase n=1 Tax=Priestia koreensis TaxID=284581 RepID=UPI001F57A7BD|nr:DEAD/DEAH box helicase [Priestia koreensis]UNL86721.1 DEAD/DEAH box helicase [Priestia koreensis]